MYSRSDTPDRFDGVDPNTLTHLIYAFVKVDTNTFVTSAYDPSGWPARLAAMKALRHANPALKLMVSVGGGGLSGDLAKLTASPNRAAVVAGAVDFVRANDLDGLDIDWEAPNNPAERQQLTAFAVDLRQGLTRLSTATRKPYTLSAAVFAFDIGIDSSFDVPGLNRSLDFFNVMSYGFGGPSFLPPC